MRCITVLSENYQQKINTMWNNADCCRKTEKHIINSLSRTLKLPDERRALSSQKAPLDKYSHRKKPFKKEYAYLFLGQLI